MTIQEEAKWNKWEKALEEDQTNYAFVQDIINKNKANLYAFWCAYKLDTKGMKFGAYIKEFFTPIKPAKKNKEFYISKQ